jgi:predicted MPP superfamily phosphohydrolase
MRFFLPVSLAAYGLVLFSALLRRNRFAAVFSGVILGIHTANSLGLAPQVARYGAGAQAVLWYGHLTTYLYFSRLSRRYSPGPFYRWLVTWPASWFSAAVFLGLPWSLARAFGFDLWAPWLPFAVASFGFLQSLVTRHEQRRIVLDGRDAGPLARYRQRLRNWLSLLSGGPAPLRVVQITDPHLGPFMSEERLRSICARAVREAPDLVLLTGDFLTIETQRSPDPLARALAPLAELRGRVFACFGNHDHECPELVKEALARAGVELLLDRATEVELPWGRVQIVGADHRWRDREAALADLARKYPRAPGMLRLWLLHDPGAFQCIPEGEADLVLSGHTHGGHLGLLSLGLSPTIVSAATRRPDHGLGARGRDRLYVHRGTGHYGFPLRVGVPSEESVLEIFIAPGALAAEQSNMTRVSQMNHASYADHGL